MKKRLSKIFVFIACIALVFCVIAIPASAIFSGQPIHNNIDGNYINPFFNFKTLRYIDILSSGTAGWKDFPVSGSYNISGFSNFRGIGKALTNTLPYQYISGNNVSQVPVLSSNFGVPSDIKLLDPLYDFYIKSGGFIDCNVIDISSALEPPTYQRVFMTYDDMYLTHDMLMGVHDGIYNTSLYSPIIQMYSLTSGYAIPVAYWGVCEYVGVNNERLSLPFSYGFTVYTGNVISGSLYYVNFNLLSSIRDALPAECKDSPVVALKDVTLSIGDNGDYVPQSITAGDYTGGCYGYRIIQPSLRTNFTASDTRNVVETDINTYVERYFNDFAGLDVEGTAFGNFASEAISGFLNMTIFPGLTIGGILFTFLAIAITMAVLKYFAGG